MLVYANHLTIEGKDASEAVFKSVGAWIKEQLGFGLHPGQLKVSGEHHGSRGSSSSWLRIVSTFDEEPIMYSWLLKVSDNAVRGRQWVTELGLKIHQEQCFFSCVLHTDEHSTLVSEEVIPSQPRVIRYLVENVKSANSAELAGYVPGTSVYHFGETSETFHILLEEIKNRKRRFPIVLVSPDRDGNYLINSEHLQEKLLGLAQVIQVSTEYNSYDMEEVLGRHWSAWNGAINIIYSATPNGFIKGQLFMSDQIESWGNHQAERAGRMLAWITHNTNIPKMRERIRAEGVTQLSLRRALRKSRDRTQNLDISELRKELENVWELADEQSKQVESLEGEVSKLEEGLELKELELQEANDEIRSKDFSIRGLKHQLKGSGQDYGSFVDIDRLMEMATRGDQPTPLECLELINDLYFKECIVLPSAKESAKAVGQFNHGRRLLRSLYKLATKFRCELMDGGDAMARNVFSRNEYAATESDTVASNPTLRSKRVFEYDGKSTEMFRHLKIGIDSDSSKTIRVHFFWDSEKKKIIIGYCGEHLPISSH
jgi:hypothetical protein